MPTWLLNLRERSLAVRAAALVAAMAGVFLSAAPVAWHLGGPAGVAAAAAAGLACLVGSGLALAAGERFRSTRRMLHGMLVGMLFRMGVPSAVAVVAYLHGEGGAHVGFFCYLVGFFEVALVVEVFLSLPPVEHREKAKGKI